MPLVLAGFFGINGCANINSQTLQKTHINQIQNTSNQTETIENIIEKAQKKQKKTLQELLQQDLNEGNFKRDTNINGVLIHQYNLDGIYGGSLKFEQLNEQTKIIGTLAYFHNPNKAESKQDKCTIQLREVGGKNRGIYFECMLQDGKFIVEKVTRTQNLDEDNQTKNQQFFLKNYPVLKKIKIETEKEYSQNINWKYK